MSEYSFLNQQEIKYLKTPMKDLTVETLQIAITAKDKIWERNRKLNADYVPVYRVPHYISDTLDRVLNPATGKYYDSKAKYYADLKATGHMVVESGMNTGKREQRGDYNVRKELKEAAQKAGLIS